MLDQRVSHAIAQRLSDHADGNVASKQLVPSGRQALMRWASPSDGPVGTGISRWARFQLEQKQQHSRSNLRWDILAPRAPACASSNLKRAYPLLLQHFGRLAWA
jgi:hypothetical protein